VKITKNAHGDYTFKADQINFDYIKSKEFKKDGAKLRGSIMILGPMLARFGEAYMPTPGGDKIGRRRLDTHFQGFVELGAEFHYDETEYFYTLKAKELRGKFILLEEASVTGTANIIMAAVLAKGKTRIYNAACEPYLQQLCRMLNRMGAKIEGIGSNLLTHRRRFSSSWNRTHHATRYGRNWFLDWSCSNDSSEMTIKNVHWKPIRNHPECFQKIGIQLEQSGDDIYIPETRTL
jgi:UDP-N-acetylglucosamine 1-carboxyvinyltransferase